MHAIGETFGQRSGVLNLGVEGQMLLGAFAAFYVALTTGSLWLGVLTAMIVGALMGLAMAYVTVNLHAQQGISGIGFYLFGLGMSDLLFQKLMGTVETVKGFPPIYIPGLVTFRALVKFSLVKISWSMAHIYLCQLAWFVLNKTTLGLEDPLSGRESGCGGFAGRERGSCPIFHDHSRWDIFRDCGCVPFHCVIECLPAKHDQRTWLYRGCVGVLWRMASVGCFGRGPVI